MAQRATDDATTTPSGSPAKQAAPGAPSPAPNLRPRPWWMLFLVVMATNFLLMRTCFPEPPSITVPYTFFKDQVEAGNVVSVTGVGDSIRGTFRSEVTYPSERAEGEQPAEAPAPG